MEETKTTSFINPGSFMEFTLKQSLEQQVSIDSLAEYTRALTNFRRFLAMSAGLTPNNLHEKMPQK